MKHRKTLGFQSDVAESAALTIADERATERIFEACDWGENPESIDIGNGIDLSDEQCIHAAVGIMQNEPSFK